MASLELACVICVMHGHGWLELLRTQIDARPPHFVHDTIQHDTTSVAPSLQVEIRGKPPHIHTHTDQPPRPDVGHLGADVRPCTALPYLGHIRKGQSQGDVCMLVRDAASRSRKIRNT